MGLGYFGCCICMCEGGVCWVLEGCVVLNDGLDMGVDVFVCWVEVWMCVV